MKEFIEEKLRTAKVSSIDIVNIVGMLNFNNVEVLEYNDIDASTLTRLHASAEAFVLYEADISQKIDIRELARPMIIKAKDFFLAINPAANYILAVNDEKAWAGNMKVVAERNLAIVGKVKMKDFTGFDNTQSSNPLMSLLGGAMGMAAAAGGDMTRKRMICSFMHSVIMDRNDPASHIQKSIIDILLKLKLAENKPKSDTFIELSKEAKDVVLSKQEEDMITNMLESKFDEVIEFIKDKTVPKEVIKFMQTQLDKLKREKCKSCSQYVMNKELVKIEPGRMTDCVALSVRNKLDSNNLAHE